MNETTFSGCLKVRNIPYHHVREDIPGVRSVVDEPQPAHCQLHLMSQKARYQHMLKPGKSPQQRFLAEICAVS